MEIQITENKFEPFIQDDIIIEVEYGKVKIYQIVDNENKLKNVISTKDPISNKSKELITSTLKLKYITEKKDLKEFKIFANTLIENFVSKYQHYLDIEKSHANEIQAFDMEKSIKDIDSGKETKEITPENKEYQEDVQKCVNNILELNNLNHHLLMETALFSLDDHQGDNELKELCILSVGSMGVANLLEAIHLHAHGLPESGKTYIFSKTKEIIPDNRKMLSDNVSPKVLYRAKLQPNTVVSLNDKIIDEAFGELLNCIADGKSWENGFVYTIVGENGEPTNYAFPPRIIFHISTNKPIIEYADKDMKVDLAAVQTKFFSFKKEYDENQKDAIKDKMLERINNDLKKDHKNLDVMKQVFETFISNPKNIHIPQTREYIENKCSKGGLRDFGQICSLCQTYALLCGYDEVNEECIQHIAELLNKIPRESKLLKDNSAIVELTLIPQKYFMFNEKVPFYQNCTVDGIAKLTKLSKNIIYPILREMKKNGLVEYQSGKNNTKYYYSLKGTALPGWYKVEFAKVQANKTPELKKEDAKEQINDEPKELTPIDL